MFVKPKLGLTVRNPKTKRPLKDSGQEVPEDSFWLRRLASGDVVRVESCQITKSEEQKK